MPTKKTRLLPSLQSFSLETRSNTRTVAFENSRELLAKAHHSMVCLEFFKNHLEIQIKY